MLTSVPVIANYRLIRGLKDPSLDLQLNCVISFFVNT